LSRANHRRSIEEVFAAYDTVLAPEVFAA